MIVLYLYHIITHLLRINQTAITGPVQFAVLFILIELPRRTMFYSCSDYVQVSWVLSQIDFHLKSDCTSDSLEISLLLLKQHNLKFHQFQHFQFISLMCPIHVALFYKACLSIIPIRLWSTWDVFDYDLFSELLARATVKRHHQRMELRTAIR